MNSSPLKSIFTTAAILAAALNTSADEFNWTGPDAGIFHHTSNWTRVSGTGTAPPANHDIATFDSGTIIDARLQGGASLDTIYVATGTHVTLRSNVTDRRSIWLTRVDESNDLIVNGTLNIGLVDPTAAILRPLRITLGQENNAQATLEIASGTITINNTGSSLTVRGNATHYIGKNDAHGNLIIRGGANAEIQGMLVLGDTAPNGSSGSINVTTGSTLILGNLRAGNASDNVVGHISVNGIGSSITHTGASTINLGYEADFAPAVSEITISNNATYTTGTGDTTIHKTAGVYSYTNATLNANGLLNINGYFDNSATLNAAQNIILDGGTFINTGTLNLAANKTFSASNDATLVFHNPLTINKNQTYNVNDTNFVTQDITLGNNHGAGTLDISNNSSTTIQDSLSIGTSNMISEISTLIVRQNSLLKISKSLQIASNNSAGKATVNITGGNSKITMLNDATLTIGNQTSGSATLTVENFAELHTGDGLLTINKTGSLILNNGFLNLHNNLLIEGGTFASNAASEIFFYNDPTLNITNGATFEKSDQWQLVPDKVTININSGSKAKFNEGLVLGMDSQSSGYQIGAILNVDGPGTTLDNKFTRVSESSCRGILVISNQATANLGDTNLGFDAFTVYAQSNISVRSGATVTTNNLHISRYNSVARHHLSIVGQDSSLTVNGSSEIILGSETYATDPNESATLQVLNDATLTTGTGDFTIHDSGIFKMGTSSESGHATLNVNGNIIMRGGEFIFHSGTINFNNQNFLLNITNNGLLGNHITNNPNNIINNAGTTAIETDGTLDIGEYFSSAKIINNGTINIKDNVSIGNASAPAAYTGTGRLLVQSNELIINTLTFAQLGSYTQSSYRLISNSGFSLGNGSVLAAHGRVIGAFSGSQGSTLLLTGDLEIGDNFAYDGFNTDGRIIVGDNALFLHDKNQVVLGSLTTIGTASANGSIESYAGFILDYGNVVTGRGVMFSDNLIQAAFINNGHIQGDSASDTISLTGYVKGTGTADNVIYTGTYAPGLSPAKINTQNIGFAQSATLEIELAGTTQGSQYDNITSSENIHLDGTLDILLRDDFNPQFQDHFVILNAQSFTGSFAQINLPELEDEIAWQITYQQNQIILDIISHLQGDTNGDGTVDLVDLQNTKDNFNGNATGDANYDGQTNLADIFAVRNNLGRSLQTATTTIPEPTSLLTLLALAPIILKRNK